MRWVWREGKNSSEQGNGVGQPAKAKGKAWDSSAGKDKEEGRGRGDCKLLDSLAKVNPAPGAFSLRIHSTTPAKSQNQQSRGRGPPCSQGEVSFRTVAGRSSSQKGSDLGDEHGAPKMKTQTDAVR